MSETTCLTRRSLLSHDYQTTRRNTRDEVGEVHASYIFAFFSPILAHDFRISIAAFSGFNIRLLISPFAFYSYLDQWVNVWSVGQCFPNQLHLGRRETAAIFAFRFLLFSSLALVFLCRTWWTFSFPSPSHPRCLWGWTEEGCSEYWCCAGW